MCHSLSSRPPGSLECLFLWALARLVLFFVSGYILVAIRPVDNPSMFFWPSLLMQEPYIKKHSTAWILKIRFFRHHIW
jgi:hypothetical protein